MGKNKVYSMIPAIFLLLVNTWIVAAQDLPDRPNPPRLVNDYAGILSRSDAERLENKLVAFNDSTSTQIAVVIVPDLKGYDAGDYAQRLGDKWGVGQKGKNNGILIIVKPKTADSRGQAFISTGYGAEGAVPDLLAARIVDNDMIPSFRNGDYYGGLNKATSTLMSLIKGKYTADQYNRRHGNPNVHVSGSPGAFFIIFFIFIIIVIFGRRGGGRHNRRISTGLPFWLLMGMMGGRGSRGGGWSSGGGWGGGGGGGGGFGGFGGGGFGGGGAGGSW